MEQQTADKKDIFTSLYPGDSKLPILSIPGIPNIAKAFVFTSSTQSNKRLNQFARIRKRPLCSNSNIKTLQTTNYTTDSIPTQSSDNKEQHKPTYHSTRRDLSSPLDSSGGGAASGRKMGGGRSGWTSGRLKLTLRRAGRRRRHGRRIFAADIRHRPAALEDRRREGREGKEGVNTRLLLLFLFWRQNCFFLVLSIMLIKLIEHFLYDLYFINQDWND